MTGQPWLRRAGHGRVPDGSLVTWSVAEGSRGRRWREVRVTAPAAPGEGSLIASSLLLELDPDGRFSHLELSTAAGLLTVHPEGDGTLHGNAVTAAGLRHVEGLAWSGDDVVLLDGSIVSIIAAIAPRGAARARTTGGLAIGLDLALARTSVTIDRSDGRVWRVEPGGTLAVDADGLPILSGGSAWLIER